MPSGRRACLVTRPEPGGPETVARVAALGWEAVAAPALLLRTRPVPGLGVAADGRSPRDLRAILLTSRAAARSLSGWMAAVPVLAVGEATAAEARRAGATRVLAADGDAEGLVALILATLPPAGGPLLLAVGAGYGVALAAALRGHGFRVLRRVVYEARPAEALPAAAREALASGRVAAALFFSPRSARVAARLLRAAGLSGAATGCDALALSARVASALDPMSWRSVRVAARPDQDALLALLGPPSHEGPSRR